MFLSHFNPNFNPRYAEAMPRPDPVLFRKQLGPRLPRRTQLWLLFFLVVGVAYIGVCTFLNRDDDPSLPGVVMQSASATSGDITVEVRRSAFTGDSVDVDLHLRGANLALGTIIAAEDVRLSGVPATSSRVGLDGRTLLRFPADAWPEDATTLPLEVTAVTLPGEDGVTGRHEGSWTLDLVTPKNDGSARKVAATGITFAEIQGEQVAFSTFRHGNSYVVRYELPAGVAAGLFPLAIEPRLASDEEATSPRDVMNHDGTFEAWFNAPPPHSTPVLVLDGLVAPAPANYIDSYRIVLENSDVGTPPRGQVPRGSEDGRIPASMLDSSSLSTVTDARWWRQDNRSSPTGQYFLEVTVVGPSFHRPVVIADGESRRSPSYGGGMHDGRPVAQVSFELDGPHVPRHIFIASGGEFEPLPQVRVALPN